MSTILQENRPDHRMDPADLAFVSDALIAMIEKDRNCPCYSDRQLDRRLEWARKRDPLADGLAPSNGNEYLTERESDALFAKANLTLRQDRVLRQRLSGMTFDEIGIDGGHTKQGAQSVFIQAIKKISRAYHVYPFVGLSEVYYQETHRGRHFGTSGRMNRSANR